MNRAWLTGLAVGCVFSLAGAVLPLDPDEREASVGYINNLQNPDGGFRPSENDRVSQLAATTSSLRALKYLGGRPRDKEGPVEFVQRCCDPSGGFADTPGGKPDVRSTAMGLMAAVELKMPLSEKQERIVGYFVQNARGLPDIYIAAAALHAAEILPPNAQDWIAAFEATRNAEGSYGKGAFDTAGAVITTLRLGGTVKDRDTVVRILTAAQQPDGGFASADKGSDLGASYRVMRAFYMLKAKPDLASCEAFIGRCRNSDGGYGVAPGQPSAASATYFAAIVLHWIHELGKQ